MVSMVTAPARALRQHIVAPYLHSTRYQLSPPKFQIGECVRVVNPDKSDPLDWDSYLVTGIKHSGISSLNGQGWMNQPSWFYALKPAYSARKEIWIHEDDLCLVGEEYLAKC